MHDLIVGNEITSVYLQWRIQRCKIEHDQSFIEPQCSGQITSGSSSQQKYQNKNLPQQPDFKCKKPMEKISTGFLTIHRIRAK